MNGEFYWNETDIHPSSMPIVAREAWHRDAWDREQDALGALVGENVTERLDGRPFGPWDGE